MTYTVDDYLEQAKALLPRGMLWDSLNESEEFTALLTALVEEFSRIDGRVEDIINETDPRTTYELLPEWENFAGLPNTCITVNQTLQQRREALRAQLINDNGQSMQFFIELAASLGYTITITEFTPHRYGDRYGRHYRETDWIFVWRVNSPSTTVTVRRYGQATYGERYRVWGNQALECVFKKLVHAHRKIIFSYGG